jgi:polyvinyl alcohol dehydrogenase (cytochrome)
VDEAKERLYVTTGDNYSDPPTAASDALLALDLKTGRIVWSKQFTAGDTFNMSCGQPGKGNCPQSPGRDLDFGSSPILVSLPSGKRALLLAQKSGFLHAVDPDAEGQVLWQAQVGEGRHPVGSGGGWRQRVCRIIRSAFRQIGYSGQTSLGPREGRWNICLSP